MPNFKLIRTLIAGLFASLLATPAANAEPAPAQAPAAAAAATRCSGNDMLPEMQGKAPDRFKKVIEESAKVTNTEAVFWKIEKAGLEPSYLLGTMHLTDPRTAEVPAKAKAAIAESKVVTLEVADVSQEAMNAAMTRSAPLLVYTDGSTLEKKLTPDEYAKVKSTVSKSGMPGDFAGLLRPWIVNLFLSMSDCERQKVASGVAVLDMNVETEAKKHGVKVNGFETVDEQLQALASVPEDQQIAMLKVALRYIDRIDDLMETLVQMYLKRQIGAALPFQVALAEEQGMSPLMFEGFKKFVLTDRNARMRDEALPLLAEGKAFIAVGALHLTGPQGLVALLRDAGYTVTAVE